MQSVSENLSHMLWLCPCLEDFWKEIFETLLEIKNIHIQSYSLLAIFEVAPPTQLSTLKLEFS